MRHPLLDALLALRLPAGDHALFGSGPLLARGWIDDAGDLDVLARGAAWQAALRLGDLVHIHEHDVDVVVIEEDITVGTRWAIGEVDTDALIDTAEIVDGIPCVRLEHVIAYKRLANRPKDRRHLTIIDARLGGPDC